MKNTVKILLILLLINLSCSKPQDENTQNLISSENNSQLKMTDLIGQWKVVSKTKNGVNLELDNCIQNVYVEFKKYTFIVNESVYMTNVTYKFCRSDNQIYESKLINGSLDGFNWATNVRNKYYVFYDGVNLK